MADAPGGQNCGSCRYHGRANGHGYSDCRRHPPVLGGHSHDSSQFPRCHADSWCGEWQKANPETVSEGAATLARLVLLGDLTAARALADKLREDA